MDWTALITGVLSFVGGIGAVAAFAGKYLPITQKYIGIAQDALALINATTSAAKPDADGKVTFTADEIQAIKDAAMRLEVDFKK